LKGGFKGRKEGIDPPSAVGGLICFLFVGRAGRFLKKPMDCVPWVCCAVRVKLKKTHPAQWVGLEDFCLWGGLGRFLKSPWTAFHGSPVL
jgi:hypothetical protein